MDPVIGGALIGAGTSMLSSIGGALGIGNKKQIRTQKELNQNAAELNYSYGEKAAENAFGRQMEMYNRSYQDESPAAKKKQLEDAGLSVGLMYSQGGGMGGAGTATTAPQGGGAGGQQGGRAPSGPEQQMAGIRAMELGLQFARMKSEIDVNKSAAEKNRAEAEATSGYRGDEARASTEKTKIDTEIGKLNLNLGQQTFTENITRAVLENEQRRSEIKLNEAETTQREKQIEVMTAEIAKTMSQTDLNILEQTLRSEEVKQGWAKVAVAREQVATAKDSNQVQREKQTLDREIKELERELERELNGLNINQKDRSNVKSIVIRGAYEGYKLMEKISAHPGRSW